MKRKIISIALILIMLLGELFIFSGCGKNEENNSENQNDAKNIATKDSEAEVVKNFYNAYFNNSDKTKFLDYMDFEIMGLSDDEESKENLKIIKERLQNRKDNNSPEVEIEPINVNSQEEFNELYKKYYNVDANEQNLETPYAIWKKQLGDDCEIYFAIIKNAGEDEIPDICAVKNGKIAHTLGMEFWFSGAIYNANKSN